MYLPWIYFVVSCLRPSAILLLAAALRLHLVNDLTSSKMMSAIGRNASKILRASARASSLQEGVKALPAVQNIRKLTVMPIDPNKLIAGWTIFRFFDCYLIFPDSFQNFKGNMLQQPQPQQTDASLPSLVPLSTYNSTMPFPRFSTLWTLREDPPGWSSKSPNTWERIP